MKNQVNKEDKINILLSIFFIIVLLLFFTIVVYFSTYIAVNNSLFRYSLSEIILSKLNIL